MQSLFRAARFKLSFIRTVTRTRLIALSTLLVLSLLAGCGGGGNTNNTPTSLILENSLQTQLTTVSLDQGGTFLPTSVAKNSKGTVIFPVLTWTTSNPQIATVSNQGYICAGTWDAAFINCSPSQTGSATITATIGSLSASLTVTVHPRITNITLTPASAAACTSQTKTLQYVAHVFSGTTDVTASAGTISYNSSNTSVGIIDANGLLTSIGPGASLIAASAGTTTSTPVLFVACPPAAIKLHLANETPPSFTTNFNLNIGDSHTLAADVVDTLGNPISGLNLTYSSASPAAATASGGTLTAVAQGFSTVVATCLPSSSCNTATGIVLPANSGFGVPIYSNMVTATVEPGTTPATPTLYVTGATAADGTQTNTTLYTIATATNTVGTPITLPGVPNSMRIAENGTVYIGTSAGLVVATSSAVSGIFPNAAGKIIGVSHDGTQVITYNAAASQALVFNSGGTNCTGSTSSGGGCVSIIYNVTNATQAVFTPDNYKAFIAAQGEVIEFVGGKTPQITRVSSNPTTVTAVPQDVAAYASPTATNQLTSIAACNNAVLTTPTVANAPALLQASADGARLIGVGADWENIPYTVTSVACPPVLAEAGTTNAAYSGYVPGELALTSDSKYAFALNGTVAATAVPFYDIQTATVGSAALANNGGIVNTGGVSTDATKLWVGVTASGAGTANAVHFFDLTQATPTDSAQIPVSIPPQFVVVQP